MVNIVRQVWLARKTVHHTKLDRNVHRLKTSNTPGIGITLSNILSSFYSFSSKSKATMLKNVKQALAPIVLQSLYRNKEIHIYSRMDRSRIGLNFQAISDEVYHPSDQYALRHLFTCVILSTSGQNKYQFINYQTSSQFFNCFYRYVRGVATSFATEASSSSSTITDWWYAMLVLTALAFFSWTPRHQK